MSDQTVLLEREQQIATITMNRPQALNSLHPDLITELIDTLLEAEADDEVRVIVLTGAGDSFCAGGDLPYLESLADSVQAKEYIEQASQITTTIMNLDKPVIAMINGAAAGAGFNLALACDIIYCSQEAIFAQSFSKIGLIPDCGGTYLLPQVVGPHKAKELMFTADSITAKEALDLGIVNQVVDEKELEDQTYQFAQRLAQGAPLALSLIKQAVNQSNNLTLQEAISFEANAQTVCLATEDNQEGIAAFKEKRKPEFKGK